MSVSIKQSSDFPHPNTSKFLLFNYSYKKHPVKIFLVQVNLFLFLKIREHQYYYEKTLISLVACFVIKILKYYPISGYCSLMISSKKVKIVFPKLLDASI